jgi:RHS repeat-associated protein
MPAGRVLATQQARDAAKQLLALTRTVKQQVGKVLQQGRVLADPQRWDGGVAGKWRNDWTHDASQLNQTTTKLDELEQRAHKVVEDIFAADSGAGPGDSQASGTGGQGSATLNDPVLQGVPPTSGYANDPVNTASGNFVETEVDLSFAGLLQAMQFNRTFNSRSDQVGPFGRGWASWATTRLRATPSGARWESPDGQQAVIPVSVNGAGYQRVLGIPGLVVPSGDGLALEWFGGSRWEFDAEGLPVRAVDGPGTQVRFAHEQGRLVELIHEGGRRLRLDWGGARIVGVACSDGRRLAYRYDESGNLIEADGGPSGVRRYEVDAQGRVLAVLDADDVVQMRNTYDSEGRVLAQVSAHGRRSRMRYLPGNVTIVDDEDGGPVNTYRHDEHGRLTAVVDGHGAELTKTYDRWGNPTTVTDRNGAVTVQEWDDRSRRVRQALPSGAVLTFSHDESDRLLEVAVSTGASTRFRYEGAERTPVEVIGPEGGVVRMEVADGLVRRMVDPDGVEVSFGFDSDGNITSVADTYGNTAVLERDAAGWVTAVVSPAGRRTELSYDRAGNPIERRDPGGEVWRFGYTAAGRLASVTDPTGARTETRYGPDGEAEQVIDALGYVTSRRFDTLGNLVGMVSPDGAKWEFSYDSLCRLVGIHDPAGASWLREHDAEGNLTASIDPLGARRIDTVNQWGRIAGIDDGVTSAEFDYDELGRATAQRRPDGTESRASYDLCGRRTSTTDPLGGVTRYSYTPAGRLARVTSPLGHSVAFEYDRAGRLVTEIDPRGLRRAYRYDAEARVTRVTATGQAWYFDYDAAGRLATRRGSNGGTTRYDYDTVGRLTQVTDPTDGVTRFSYDSRGYHLSATDANGAATHYEFNARGWLSTVTDPLGGIVEHRYDEVGRLVATTDQLGRTTRWEYDPAGQRIRQLAPAGNQVRWSYDPSGRLAGYQAGDADPVTIERDSLGRAVVVQEPDRRHQLAWDPLDRLIAKRSGGVELTWRYDADGRQIAANYPDGTHTAFTHDPAGALTSAAHPLLGTIALHRDEAGRLTGLDHLGGSESWSYRDSELVGHSIERDGQRRVTELERDAAGRVITETRDGVINRYHYDAAGQLTTTDTPDGARAFSYDPAGRLITETGSDREVGYTYDAASQLCERRRGNEVTRYTYDAAGRRQTETGPELTRTFTWNSLDQLTGIHRQDPAGESTIKLTVDAFGDLASVNDTPLAWDPTGLISQLRCLGDNTVIGSDEQTWAQTDAAGAVTWLNTDWQHSTNTADHPGDPWGATQHADATPQLGWRGELTIDGLTWLRNRAYDPGTRAFLSPDPLPAVPGTPTAANPYHYANNNPINLLDPLGLRPATDADLADHHKAHHGGLFGGLLHKATHWAGNHLGDIGHGALDVAGMIPVVGTVAEGINAVWYGAEGNYGMAALSAAGMIPGLGDAAIAAKFGVKGLKAAEAGFEGTEALKSMKFLEGSSAVPDEASNVVYRALNSQDVETMARGEGIVAKSPEGEWSLAEHIVRGSSSTSWANDPWISTSWERSVAEGFNESGSKLGVVTIDLDQVSSATAEGWRIYPRLPGKAGLPYHYSIWQQEVSVFQRIPQEAIKGFVK